MNSIIEQILKDLKLVNASIIDDEETIINLLRDELVIIYDIEVEACEGLNCYIDVDVSNRYIISFAKNREESNIANEFWLINNISEEELINTIKQVR